MQIFLAFLAVAFIPWMLVSSILLFLDWAITATAILIAMSIASAYLFFWRSRIKDSQDSGAREYYRGSKWNLAFLTVALLITVVILPKAAIVFSLSSDAELLGQLSQMRETLEDYKRKNGIYPKNLKELGPLPVLRICVLDKKTSLLHYHTPSDLVTIVREASFEEADDEGHWGYNPDTGHILILCHGVDTKRREPWYLK